MDPTWGHHKWREPDLDEKQARAWRDRLVEDYRRTFETDHGNRVLRHLIRISGMLDMSTFRESADNLRAEGATNMIKSILMQLSNGHREPVITSIIDDNLEKMYGTASDNDHNGFDVIGGYAVGDDSVGTIADSAADDIAAGD